MSTRALPSLFAAACFAALAPSCQLDETSAPAKPVVQFSLAEATVAEPALSGGIRDQIAGSLGMLFGSPTHPKLMRLSDWAEEYDPNYPQFPADDFGGGEFDEAQLGELWQDNPRYFRRQLAAIDAGRYEDVVAPDWSPDLAESYAELLAGAPPAARDAAFAEQARKLFVEYYPTLDASAELYRQHCLHCHGPEGGGNGPTGRFLNPRPRDYRLGLFKFTAVGKSVPRRADLFRILDEGVTGTAMPSFRRFAKSQLHGLVDYVRLLSMRGMVERDLVNTFKNDEALSAEDVLESYKTVWEKWNQAKDKVLAYDGEVPAPSAESIAHGRELFMDATKGNCFSCHGPEGRGDGASAFVTEPETGLVKPAYKDEWGNEILPRNLRLGVFRGGRRPIDLYRRVKNGIAGTPMPEAASSLADADIWSLVHYVGTLSEKPAHAAAAAAPESTHGGEPAKH